VTPEIEVDDEGARKVSIRREPRPVIVKTGTVEKIEYQEIPVPPPAAGRRPANSPY
jgi:hypothetical protein